MSDDTNKPDEAEELAGKQGGEHESEVVPGFVPLKEDQRPIITHEELRAVETARPVLPGTNEERKKWALLWFTSSRLLLIFSAGALVIYFFLLINHIRLHASYPVNFPDIDEKKVEIRTLQNMVNDLGNVRLRRSEAGDLQGLVIGFESIRDQLVTAQLQAELKPGDNLASDAVSKLDDRSKLKVVAKNVTLADVADRFADENLRVVVEEAKQEIAKVAEAPWDQIADVQGNPGPLQESLTAIGDSFTDPTVAKLVKSEMATAYLARRTANIEYIRDRDLQLRIDYFTLADRKIPGTWVMFFVCIAIVMAARAAWTYNPLTRLPIANPNKGNEQQREAAYARWGIVGMVACVFIAWISLLVTAPPHIKEDVGVAYAQMQEANAKAAEKRRLLALEEQQRQAEERRAKIAALSQSVSPEDFASQSYRFGGSDTVRVAASFKASGHEALWAADLPLAGMGQPVIWKDTVIVAAANKDELRVLGFSAKDGSRTWQRSVLPTDNAEVWVDDTTGDMLYAAPTPVVDGARAFAIFSSGDLVCVEIGGGDLLWRRHLGVPAIEWCHVQSPLLYDGKLIVPMIDGGPNSGVYCIDPDNGETIWHGKVSGHSWATPAIAPFAGGKQLVVYGDKVRGMNLADGSILWEGGSTETGDWGPSVAFDGGLALVGMKDHATWGFKEDGTIAWTKDSGLQPDYPSPIAADGSMWVLGMEGDMERLASADGTVQASTKLKGNYWASPVLIGKRLLVTAVSGTVQILDADSLAKLGELDLKGKSFAPPAVRPGLAVFRTQDELVAYEIGAAGAEEAVEITPPTKPAVQPEVEPEAPKVIVDTDPFILKPAEGTFPVETASSADTAEWGAFRGPDGQGIVLTKTDEIPDTWNGASGEGIKWKADLPLAGIGQPVVWGDQIIITAADAKQRLALSIDRQTGKELWRTEIPSRPKDGSPRVYSRDKAMGPDYMYAAATPAVDGERVYMVFANGDLATLNLANGEPLWVRDLGIPVNKWGHSQSLRVHAGRLIVPWDQKASGSACYSFEPATGELQWEIKRPEAASFSSPTIVETTHGWQLYLLSSDLRAYNPKDGSEIWRGGSYKGDVSPTPVYTQDKVFPVWRGGGLQCFRVNGKGDVNETHLVWQADPKEFKLSQYSSPVSDGRRLWTVGSKGEVTCFDVQTGKATYTIEEIANKVYAAPLMIGKRLLVIDNDGNGFWIAADSKPSLHRAGTIPEPVYAAPVVTGNSILIRGKNALWCVGDKE